MRAFGADVELIHSPGGITPDLIPAMVRRAGEIARRPAPSDRPVQQHRHDRGLPPPRRGTARAARPAGIDAFCGYVGTAGCFLGITRALREKLPRCTASRSSRPSRRCSPAVGRHAPHRGRRHRPLAAAARREDFDEVIAVPEADAFAMARRAARADGIFSGPSTGANLVAALRSPGGSAPAPGGHRPGRQRPEVPRRRPLRRRLTSAGAASLAAPAPCRTPLIVPER